MKFKQLIYLSLIIISSCKDKDDKQIHNVQMDIRFGNKYYSLFFSEDGNCKVNKGVGTYFTEPFKPQEVNSTIDFKIDSIILFYEKLNILKENPKIDTVPYHMTRAEIYFERKKIVDSYRWDKNVTSLIGTIMEKIPKGFNPFRVSDNPF